MNRLRFRSLALVFCLHDRVRVARERADADSRRAGHECAGSGNWPVYIALAQNFFSDEGLKVTPVLSGSNVATINVLATADANVGLDGSDIEIAAVVHGLPIKIVAPEFGPNPYTVLVSAGINSWADLKGKSVTLGSPQDVSLAVVLQDGGDAPVAAERFHGVHLSQQQLAIRCADVRYGAGHGALAAVRHPGRGEGLSPAR